MGDIQGVNQVRKDDRYKLPPELGERYRGKHLAAYEKDGKIILEPVEVGE